jgi:hypothetical protein
MELFYCFTAPDDASNYNCVIKVGSVFALPIFNHGGFNSSIPSYCECDDVQWRQSAECNLFHFLSGFIFYDYNSTETSAESVDRMKYLLFGAGMDATEINRRAYDISYDAVNKGSVTRGDQVWLEQHFAFCRTPRGRHCSILSVYKTSPTSSATSFHFPVYNGSCNDFVSYTQEGKERIASTPPIDLIEPYLKCHRTVWSALQDAMGIVSGNITAISPLIMLALFYLYYYGYVRMKGDKQDVTYSKRELEAIFHFFTFNLALARDGLHPTQLRAEAAALEIARKSGEGAGGAREDVLEKSVLLRLLEELKQEDVSKA